MEATTQTQTSGQPLPNSGPYMSAKKHGFAFKGREQEHTKRIQKREDIIDDIGEKPKPIKVALAFICIGIALCLGLIEAQNVKTTIVGSAGFSDNTAIIVGWAFASMGLVCGELLSSGLKLDAFTGTKKPTNRWYVGLALTAVYLLGQYYLASRASIGADETMQSTVETMKWFVLGIAVTEVLFGYAFLAISLKMLSLFVANIRIKMTLRKMRTESRMTEEFWQRHLFEHSGNAAGEETPAIHDAREFYNTGGFHEEPNSLS